VTSISGDGTFITNSGSTGTVTLTLGNAAAHSYWGNNTGSTGAPAYHQPAFSDLSGSAACAQLPALTGDTTTSAGSCATTTAKINGTAFSGTANDVVAFGTGGTIPLDTSILYTNLVTASSAASAANQIAVSAGANKALSYVCNAATAGSLCYWNGSAWTLLAGNSSGTEWLQETASGVPSWTTPGGGGNVSNSGTPTQYQTAVWVTSTSIEGIGPGTSGYPLVSGGASTYPGYAQLTSTGLNVTTTSCTNQVVTAISSGVVGTCTTLTSSYLPAATVYNNQANTYTTGLQNLNSATLELPSSAGYAPTAASLFGYDSTNNRLVFGNGTTTAVPGFFTAALNGSRCLQTSGTIGLLVEASAACGTGGVTSITGDGNIITNSSSTGAVTLTIAGTSGGVPYFSSTSAWNSSALLTANAIMVGGGAGTAPATDSSATLSGAALTLGASGTPGTLLTYPSSGNFTTTWGSAATASNTILGFSSAPTTGDLVSCTTSSTTCTLTDSTVLAANVVTASSAAGGAGYLAYSAGANKALSYLTPTSGGVVYGLSSTSVAFSSALAQYAVVVGGGAGAAPATITAGGAGTVLAGAASATPSLTATPTFGVRGTTLGSLTLAGASSTSGTLTLNGYTSGSCALTVISTGGTLDVCGTNATIASTGAFSGTTFTSTVSTGTAPFTVTSTTQVANLSAASLGGATFAAPGAIGGTTPSTAAFTTITAGVNGGTGGQLTLNGATSGSSVLSVTAAGTTLNLGSANAYVTTAGALTVASCSGCASLSFPLTVSGTTTSGGIPYFSSTTALSSSALLAANHILLGGGAGAAPTSDSALDDGATTANTLTYTGTGGAALIGSGAKLTIGTASCTVGTAGAICLGTGTAPTAASSYNNIWADSSSGEIGGQLGTASTGPIEVAAISTQTGTYSVLATDYTILCNGTFTLTLPTSGILSGKSYRIKNIGTGQCTISAGGTVNIDNATTYPISTQYQTAEFVWNGTQYYVF